MSLTITNDLITSDRTPHAARRLGNHQHLYVVSWMPLYPVGRTTALAAMKIADIVGDGSQPVEMTEIDNLARLIGTRGTTAVEQVMEPPDECELIGQLSYERESVGSAPPGDDLGELDAYLECEFNPLPVRASRR